MDWEISKVLFLLVVSYSGSVASFTFVMPPLQQPPPQRRSRTFQSLRLSYASSSQLPNNLSLDTAVAIVPPDTAWDKLQQARHWVQDSTVTKWPPAIRLFHPFVSMKDDDDDTIFAMANCIEQINQQEFQITLSEWSIIPHIEQMDLSTFQEEEAGELDPDRLEIQKLIAREEAIGKVNKAKREGKIQNNARVSGRPPKQTHIKKQQKEPKVNDDGDVFNGPCVIVLEPDARSQQLLKELRRSLRSVLPESFQDYYSPTSTMPSEYTISTSEWRPVVPIATVSTTAAAIPLARHLRASWEPIVFNVTDLHVISSHQEVFGCDALISFVGHEPIPMDDPVHQEMAYIVADQGIPGGADINQRNTTMTPEISMGNHDEARNNSDHTALSSELEQWLYDDDDAFEEDDGVVVVIGRVQFFTGSQRDYIGMPAISAWSASGPWSWQSARNVVQRSSE